MMPESLLLRWQRVCKFSLKAIKGLFAKAVKMSKVLFFSEMNQAIIGARCLVFR